MIYYQSFIYIKQCYINHSNLISCFLLLIIPIICFKKLFFGENNSILAPTILMMNLINAGNIMSTPFFNVDLLNGVFFSLATMFFYKKNILAYLITTCLAIMIKEISIILLIPLLFLINNKDELSFFKKVLICSIPVIIFFSIRFYFTSGIIGLNIGHNGSIVDLNTIFKEGFSSFYYIKEVHGFSIGNFLLFLIRSFISIGFVFFIAFYLRIRLKMNKNFFIVTSIVVLLVVLAVFLHASGVQRTTQVVTPFLVFYSLSVLEKKLIINKSV